MTLAIAYVTHSSMDDAKELAKLLINEGLCACANFFPIESIYPWEGNVTEEKEAVSLLKTSVDLYDKMEERILEIHPYDTPCVLRLDPSANFGYKVWVENLLP